MSTKRAARPHVVCPDTMDGDCYYCLRPILDTPRNHQHDHFPIPYRDDGEDVVCTCMECHKLLDTVSLGNWPASLAFGGIRTLLDNLIDLDPAARLVAAKMFKIALDSSKRSGASA
jgi:hypothetical protein